MSIVLLDEDLARLEHKYVTMARLRRDHARGKPEAPLTELRALARAFPGSLSELDTMETEEIEARVIALAEARASLVVLPWMRWVFAYHAGLREALEARKDVALTTRRARSRLPIDEAFVEAARARPNGRVVPVVLAAIARWTGDDPAAIEHALLPRRRKRS
ncbi:MAG: hypothetical protein HOW73_28975 [Polyangiaceae bacterium]|nr:hypothetical protein [Polyangiaceae bacterium]